MRHLKQKVTVAGASVIGDYIFKVDHLPSKGEVVCVEKRYPLALGGCALNIAVGLAVLGMLSPSLVYPVGSKDFEEFGVSAQMQKYKIEEHFTVVPDCFSGLAWMYMQKDGTTMCFSDPGASGIARFNNPEVLSEWVIISPVLNAFTEDVLNAAIARNSRIVINGICSENLLNYLQYCHILFVNSFEFSEILQLTKKKDIEEFASFYPDMLISVTNGSKGSLIWDGKALHKIPIIKEEKKEDFTGAGDAYISGFLSAYLMGMDAVASSYFGAANSSFIIERVGGQNYGHTWEDLEIRLKENGYSGSFYG